MAAANALRSCFYFFVWFDWHPVCTLSPCAFAPNPRRPVAAAAAAVCCWSSGPCSFSLTSDFRTAGLPQAAASFIVAPHGPTLTGQGAYALPTGVRTRVCVCCCILCVFLCDRGPLYGAWLVLAWFACMCTLGVGVLTWCHVTPHVPTPTSEVHMQVCHFTTTASGARGCPAVLAHLEGVTSVSIY